MTYWISLHHFSVVAALVLFGFSLLFGILFMIQESRFKQREIPYDRLPPLALLQRVYVRALSMGWILLTVGIGIGFVLSWSVRGFSFASDPLQWGAIIAWLLYLVFLKGRWSEGWCGRRGFAISLLGFAAIILTFLGTHHGVTR